ncbi:uncharacterized protein LOC130770956 isoform X4 [Actinidia eriantha]|uniref:uncharacterized protein LOC130770956 isoform X4 n=1 Tax=Actinidia eriantha TaxID=165200 RepID=UPI00259056A8|nr:uncharacterized protein LOC130770956 isoform X4 [Actinidia eriantha]XP_057484807.1 uncharacterized protein LOC130770956 isoform X4 [Actinidia eriantha]
MGRIRHGLFGEYFWKIGIGIIGVGCPFCMQIMIKLLSSMDSDISIGCPALRTLVLPSNVLQGPQFKIQNHMSKWTSLQSLKLQRCFDMEELLTQISIHCKSFVALAIETANIGKDEASAIVNFLPNIKVLVLRDCTGFTESDEEILKHASRIRSFKHEGSMGSMSFYFSYRSVDGFRW